ncbi:hypothetical protein CLV98_102330 [Dyadobacter jejuensis]|uniref:Thioredoxin domain-containing protein n=1 Tax=Dyadobacter jejuensis TaxID=1082580 RepID=A0A316APY3_9BACT|nr:hypothetical protein [Dyadobacter jejuensis]PWJ59496.1 hypothetical protein CLV98_102330 [Dyadobacter jejuensis]
MPRIYKYSLSLLLVLLGSRFILAQSTSKLVISGAQGLTGVITLVQEDVGFHPNLGVGLADSKLAAVASVPMAKRTIDSLDVALTTPTIFRLQYAGEGVNKTWILYVEPGDELMARVEANHDIYFEGTRASYQEFLKTYFLENQYQYLPVFGFKPTQVDNQMVVVQSDSLKMLRERAFKDFKANTTVSKAFEGYVRGVTLAEPMVMSRLIQERIMRKNRVKTLDAEQQKLLDDYSLANFEILPDEALLSKAYRDELRNWVLIPTLRKYPVDKATRFEISPEAIHDLYLFSKAKLAPYPKQQEYLLTYWLNYANTAVASIEPGKSLMADYESTLPHSPYIPYLKNQVATREKLVPGSSLPALALQKTDGSIVEIDRWKGLPLVLVFAYSIGQHEPDLKKMEEQFSGKVQFAYVSVIRGLGADTWKTYVKDRPTAIHLWATDDQIGKMEDALAIDIRYPFLVANGQGKILNRWIPQEFPDNAALNAAIQKALAP